MESIWLKTVQLPAQKQLDHDITTDVAIIGGGMAGLLTSYQLKQKGIQSVVLEGERVANGVTGHTTAKITAQHGLIYHKLIKDFGKEKAQQYATANSRAIDEYRRIISDKNIDCHFRDCANYVYTLKETDNIEAEVRAAKSLGLDACFTKETELPFSVTGAIRVDGQATFHPLEFLQAILPELTIYENTYVREVDENTVVTDCGRVTAKKIIVATHYPFINTPGYYFMRMHQERSYVIAFDNVPVLENMYIDEDSKGFSFRSYENFLLLGGGGHRTGKSYTGGGYGVIIGEAVKYFQGSVEFCRWSTQDCMPLDQVPYIGQYSSSTPNLYVATGFHKWGMTNSMAAAMILSDQIAGAENDFSEIFCPQRFNVTASAKNLLKDSIQTVSGLIAQNLKIPEDHVKLIKNGSAGIVDYEGQKYGVYKDKDGQIFVVTTKCPHLGCQLEWNAEELSWDCPCHGSRFDYKGNLLDNPAMKGIEEHVS